MNKLRKIIILILLLFILVITSKCVYAKFVISQHKEITMLVKSSYEEPLATPAEESENTESGTLQSGTSGSE